MDKFIFLEDEATADIAFIAIGKTKAEMITNSCLALTNVITDSSLIEPKNTFEKKFQAEDLLGLIYDLLNYLLFLFDSEDMLFNTFLINLDEDRNIIYLKAKGEKYNPKKHEIRNHVKAVTFFGMKFEKEWLKITLDL